MTELLTKAAYARRKGVNRSAVTRAVHYGRVVLTAEGLVDVQASDEAWESMRSRPAPGADEAPLSDAALAFLSDDGELAALLAAADADVAQILADPELDALVNSILDGDE